LTRELENGGTHVHHELDLGGRQPSHKPRQSLDRAMPGVVGVVQSKELVQVDSERFPDERDEVKGRHPRASFDPTDGFRLDGDPLGELSLREPHRLALPCDALTESLLQVCHPRSQFDAADSIQRIMRGADLTCQVMRLRPT